MVAQSFELFADFLATYKLEHTQEIFKAEANFTPKEEVRKGLEAKFGSGAPLALRVLAKARAGPAIKASETTKIEVKPTHSETTRGAEVAKAVSDLKEKSAQFDQILERRKAKEREKELEAELQREKEMEMRRRKMLEEESEKSGRATGRGAEKSGGPESGRGVEKHHGVEPVKAAEVRESPRRKTEQVQFENPYLKAKLGEPTKNNYLEKGKESTSRGAEIDRSLGRDEEEEEVDGVTDGEACDLTVDSNALEEFDYSENIEKRN